MLTCILLLFGLMPVGAQQYKTLADTQNLNKEYVALSNEIASLTAKLEIARNNLPAYQTKANESASDARQSASTTSTMAQNAVNGTVKEARRAKRKARKSVQAAKSARSADADYKDQQGNINNLANRLNQKNERLLELNQMRKNILAQQQSVEQQ